MANNYFDIYLEQTFALAETLVIKSSASANGINKRMVQLYGEDAVDFSRPHTWKYYLNISGEYHPIDTKMEVISMDTLETIEFNKENLKIHRSTAREYQYGTRKYLELVNKYPTQEMLILGILNPADIIDAINAKDGQILAYNKKLVEFNEYSFIEKLQDWINVYLAQNYNPQYSVSDELYESMIMGKLYMDMIPAIMNIRLRACRTNEAHSYHVRRYLASHGFLDEYMDNLTTKQALWCYRNINYVEKYSGHQDTFEWLIENILTVRNIPIGEYNMYHDTSTQPNGIEPFDPTTIKDNIYPKLMFDKTDLNPIASTNEGINQTLDGIFTKEDKIAVDNIKFHPVDVDYAKEKMESSLSNKLKTKVLESAMYDYADSKLAKMSDVLLNHWVNRAFNGTYRAVVLVNNPKTGENIPLNSKEALYLMYYAYMRTTGWEHVKYIPTFAACCIPRDPLPTADEIRKHVPWKRISRKAAQLALDLLPETSIAYSTEQFYNDCVAYLDALNNQYNLVSVYEDYMDRGYAENMIHRIYCIKTYPPERKITFEAWLEEKNIYVDGFDHDDWESLYKSLLATGTGMTLNTTISTRALQKALTKLLLKLSSYSIQLVTDINKSSLQQSGGIRIRLGDRDLSIDGRVEADVLNIGVEDILTSVHTVVDMDTNKIDYSDTVDASVKMEVDYELPNIFDTSNGIHYDFKYYVPLTRINITHGYGVYPNKYNISPMWLNEGTLDFDAKAAFDLVDIYQRNLGCSLNMKDDPINIKDYWFDPYLNGFGELKPSVKAYYYSDEHQGFKEVVPSVKAYWIDSLKPGFVEGPRKLSHYFTDTKHRGFKDTGAYGIDNVFVNNTHDGFNDIILTDINNIISIRMHPGLREYIVEHDISSAGQETDGFNGVEK